MINVETSVRIRGTYLNFRPLLAPRSASRFFFFSLLNCPTSIPEAPPVPAARASITSRNSDL